MSTTVISEVGVNHDGSLDTALRLIEASAEIGADFVKFQKKTPELAEPMDRWNELRDTPWGQRMTRLDYRHRMEFTLEEFAMLQSNARMYGISMCLSVWDLPSLEFENQLACPWIKIPSARVLDLELIRATCLQAARRGAQAVVLSTGGSDEEQVHAAVEEAMLRLGDGTPEHLPKPELWVLHCHMAYPVPDNAELNLMCIPTLAGWMYERWGDNGWRSGYSGHEYGITPTAVAVGLGAEVVERHITLDRTSPGSDHSSSLEPWVFKRLVAHIRKMDDGMLGDGVKRVWASEGQAIARLRGTDP